MTPAGEARFTARPAAQAQEIRAAEQAHHVVQKGRAARTVAGHSNDFEDCGRLLEMLGLDAAEGKLA
jgi:hypothetical protein